MSEPAEILAAEFNGAISDLIQCYGGPAECRELSRLPDRALPNCGHVELRGDQVTGGVTILTDAEDPAELGITASGHAIADCVRELANQAAGRFRNRATRLGLDIGMGLPCSHKTCGCQSDGWSRFREYRWSDRILIVATELMVGSDLSLDPQPDDLVAGEGSVILF